MENRPQSSYIDQLNKMNQRIFDEAFDEEQDRTVKGMQIKRWNKTICAETINRHYQIIYLFHWFLFASRKSLKSMFLKESSNFFRKETT